MSNGEGYRDPTADMANKIVSARSDYKLEAGEIWSTTDNQGNEILYLIIKPFKKHSEVLRLLDDDRTNDLLVVACRRGTRYVNPKMLGYCFNDRFEHYVQKVSDECMTRITGEIIEKLDLLKKGADESDVMREQLQIATLQQAKRSTFIPLKESKIIDMELLEKWARADAEAKAYKEMYLKLLDKYEKP